mgnify:CR=1 FL=1
MLVLCAVALFGSNFWLLIAAGVLLVFVLGVGHRLTQNEADTIELLVLMPEVQETSGDGERLQGRGHWQSPGRQSRRIRPDVSL